jgi:putative endonuclease
VPIHLAMQSTGSLGEAEVTRFLEARGFTIWGRNVRLGALEIDIVALDERVVVVVEVRTRKRGAVVAPFASLGPKKRQCLRRAGQRLWARYFRRSTEVDRLRYDVAAVYTHGEQTWIEYHRGFLPSAR